MANNEIQIKITKLDSISSFPFCPSCSLVSSSFVEVRIRYDIFDVSAAYSELSLFV